MPRIEAPHWQEPVGLILTTTTYGTWLHGDDRGSYDRHGWSRQTRFIGADAGLEAHRRNLMKQPPYLLDATARGVVDAAIREHCEHKGWSLWALNVRTNHFHAVVPPNIDGGKVLGAMKARATRMLREKGVVDPDRIIWTRMGGITLLLSDDELAAAIRYVLEGQGPALPMG